MRVVDNIVHYGQRCGTVPVSAVAVAAAVFVIAVLCYVVPCGGACCLFIDPCVCCRTLFVMIPTPAG